MEFRSPEESAYLEATFGFDVGLGIEKGVVVLTTLKGNSREATLVEAIRGSTVGKDHHNMVNRLRA